MNLETAFKKAGLVCRVQKDPLRKGRGMERIVQMDIQRSFKGPTRGEYFRIYAPESALLQVRGIDPARKQLVLLVKEEAIEFQDHIVKTKWTTPNHLSDIRKKFRVIRETERELVYVNKTSAATRYFLLGVDERQLFIAQTTNPVTTVDEAHRSLGKTVQFAEGKRGTTRQGEWFLLETSEETREQIEKALQQNRTAIKKDVDIGRETGTRSGKPHIASESVSLPPKVLQHGHPVREKRIFVRGKIRHPDHKTVHLTHWREVVRNSEENSGDRQTTGVYWVD